PFVMRYGRSIRPGLVSDEIITNVDFAPTFLEMCGLSRPEYMQGRSFRPLTEGQLPEDWPQSMYYRYWMHMSGHGVCAHYGVRTKRHKLIYYYGEALGQPHTLDES
ncbi:MAG: sulfatase/phosphatase domain-containing protein, partial [Kiritimatiellia bacterium]